jgi:hypothetical protein
MAVQGLYLCFVAFVASASENVPMTGPNQLRSDTRWFPLATLVQTDADVDMLQPNQDQIIGSWTNLTARSNSTASVSPISGGFAGVWDTSALRWASVFMCSPMTVGPSSYVCYFLDVGVLFANISRSGTTSTMIFSDGSFWAKGALTTTSTATTTATTVTVTPTITTTSSTTTRTSTSSITSLTSTSTTPTTPTTILDAYTQWQRSMQSQGARACSQRPSIEFKDRGSTVDAICWCGDGFRAPSGCGTLGTFTKLTTPTTTVDGYQQWQSSMQTAGARACSQRPSIEFKDRGSTVDAICWCGDGFRAPSGCGTLGTFNRR